MKFLGIFGALACAVMAAALLAQPLSVLLPLSAKEAAFVVGLSLVLLAAPLLRVARRRLGLICAVACGVMLAACQTSPTTSAGWGQIAAGVGVVVGETKIDPQIEKVSAKLARYCADVQMAALAVDVFATEKVQRAAQDARIVVATFCASPPRNLASALASLAAAYAAIDAARRG